MRNPSWYEDPPEDDWVDNMTPEAIEGMEREAELEDFANKDESPEPDLNWDTPTNYPYSDPDYQAEQDRRHDRK